MENLKLCFTIIVGVLPHFIASGRQKLEIIKERVGTFPTISLEYMHLPLGYSSIC